ncbi:BON domain-containing protein [Octadecabacter antarcticus]|uniref:BON domain-containing protein n=1 Tax=Octadecabacter antarcticus TaxID=1217908 RepID=UPI002FDCA8E1
MAQEAPTGTVSNNQTGEQDASIAVRIRKILAELGNYEDVTVTVSDGVVTLRGTPADRSARPRRSGDAR